MNADAIAAVGFQFDRWGPVARRSVLQLSVVAGNACDNSVGDHISKIGSMVGPIVALEWPNLRRARSISLTVGIQLGIVLKSDAIRDIFRLGIASPAFYGET